MSYDACRYYGLLLRYNGRRASLLSKQKGRVDLLLFASQTKQPLSPGALVSYYEKKKPTVSYTMAIADDVQTEYMPLLWARQDIYFLHYLLEVCYYFLPEGSGGSSFFALLKQVYQNFSLFKDEKDKKGLLCKLFSHLGVCPEYESFQEAAHQLLLFPIDNTLTTNLQLISEEIYDQWIMWCVASHPYGKWFKAMPSLIKSENV